MKIDRKKIHEKYSGHCAYCGKEITFKQMQVDHVEPQWTRHKDPTKVDSETNLMPSCRSCNHYKRSDNLEQFRQKMLTLHQRAASHYIGKVAVDFGILTVKPFDGVFYFEKHLIN